MKFIYYNSFKRKVYLRWVQLTNKQSAREKRYDDAMKYINQWDDMPLSWLYSEICEKLDIKKSKAAQDLIVRMTMPCYKKEDLIKRIPL
jgi:hypothetical protein